jgi:tetratricopeptide (TPR) repeat protein
MLVQVRRVPYLTVGWFWYLGTLLPVIGLVQVGHYARADRYAYVPLIGIYFGVSWALAELAECWDARRAAGMVAALLLTGYGIVAWKQVHLWHNSIVLWESAREATGDNYVSLGNLGLALMSSDKEAAIDYLERSARLAPTLAKLHLNLGLLYMEKGALPQAEQAFDKVIHLHATRDELQLAHGNLGLIQADQGKMQEARRHLEEAVRLNPDSARAHGDLGLLLARQGEAALSDRQFARALELEPDNPAIHLAIGTLDLERDRPTEAAARFAAAQRINPTLTGAHLAKLAAGYQAQGQAAKAAACVQLIATLQSKDR